MPAVTIRAGMHLDIPNGEEIGHITREQLHEWSAHERANLQEQARTAKDFRRVESLTTPAQTHVTVNDGVLVNSGRKWVVRLISVQLASAGTGEAFITSDSSSTLGTMTANRCAVSFTTSFQYQSDTISAGSVILNEGEGLFLNFTQNIVGYMIAGWDVEAEQIFKLY